MIGWALSAVVVVSLVAVGLGAFAAPRRSAVQYGIVLDDSRALAFIRAMGARDLVIGGLLALIAFERRPEPLGWGLCLTAAIAVADYVVVTADRRSPTSTEPPRGRNGARVLHATGAVGLVIAGGLLLAGY